MLANVNVHEIHAAEAPPVHELGSVKPWSVDLYAKAPEHARVSVAPVLTVLANPDGAVRDVFVSRLAPVMTALFGASTVTLGLFGLELVPFVEP